MPKSRRYGDWQKELKNLKDQKEYAQKAYAKSKQEEFDLFMRWTALKRNLEVIEDKIVKIRAKRHRLKKATDLRYQDIDNFFNRYGKDVDTSE